MIASDDGRLLQSVPFLVDRPHGLTGICIHGNIIYVIDEIKKEVHTLFLKTEDPAPPPAAASSPDPKESSPASRTGCEKRGKVPPGLGTALRNAELRASLEQAQLRQASRDALVRDIAASMSRTKASMQRHNSTTPHAPIQSAFGPRARPTTDGTTPRSSITPRARERQRSRGVTLRGAGRERPSGTR